MVLEILEISYLGSNPFLVPRSKICREWNRNVFDQDRVAGPVPIVGAGIVALEMIEILPLYARRVAVSRLGLL